MKEGFTPLICALFMLVFCAFFFYIDSAQRAEAAFLASEVETFLENHRTVSADHLVAQQKARQLENLVQRPNRSFLAMASLIIAVQFFLAFFKNAKGRRVSQKAAEIWTWRP
ncbi:hypothetical protein [Planktotalea sp.]|uniref:hypothetical protein n=1 Tax=Planktotalea sp. TaxID=2029877 RepID=UPI00329A6D17